MNGSFLQNRILLKRAIALMEKLILFSLLLSVQLFAQDRKIENLIKRVKAESGVVEETEKKLESKEKGDTVEIPPEEGITYEEAEELPSTIEQMFAPKFAIGVSKSIFQFGYDIFKTPSTTFAPAESWPISSTYVLGPNDELIINIWGKIQETFKVRIDRDGKIILPKAGALYIWGLKFEDAQNLIAKQLAKHYTNLEVNVTMGRLRSVRVFILGEVKQPGGYDISSLSTIFHALCNVGGPTKLGSMRKIKLVGSTKKLIDLYDILLYGNKESDYSLSSGDIIYVPPIGKVVGIAGSVKRPAIYEVKSNETMRDLIKMAGGVTPVSYLKRVQVERIREYERKVVMDLKFADISDFDKKTADFELQDGDLVLISPILPKRYNYVSIYGNIERPGDYALKPNFSVVDLIRESEGILAGTYLKRAEISRFKDDKTREIIPINLGLAMSGDSTQNIKLKEWDELVVYAKTDVLPALYVKISGAVYEPGEYELTPNMTVDDLIFRAGGASPVADFPHTELCRKSPKAPLEIININLVDSTDRAIELEPDDWLFVRERTEWTHLPKIVVTGEVVHPGIYVVNREERLSSVIHRAGGFTENAFLTGAVFARESVKQKQASATKEFVTNARKKLLEELTAIEVSGLGIEEKRKQEEVIRRRQELIDIMAEMEIPGRMIINLTNFDSKEHNIAIEDGDSLHIPKVPSTVQIIGCVYNPSGVTYREGKSLGWYLSQVGGVTKEADKKEIYILKASGKVTKRGKIKRGDTIIVPEKFSIRRPTGDVVKDIVQALYQIGFSALAIKSLL